MLLRKFKDFISNLNSIDLSAILTLITISLFTEDIGYLRAVIRILCICSLYRCTYRKAYFWFIVSLILLIGQYSIWYKIDNHKYLMGYWCLAFALSLCNRNTETSLSVNAKSLIGLSFFFALAWKLISPDYLNQSFFHFALISDTRFQELTHAFGGLPLALSRINSRQIVKMIEFSLIEGVVLQSTAHIALIAHFLTWWTLAIEFLIALTFLIPEKYQLSKSRDYLMLVFLFSTYAIATVPGFGCLLAAMGFTQRQKTKKNLGLYYILAFIMIYLYSQFQIVKQLLLL